MHLSQGKYGYFDETTHEYVITRPDVPQPWYNYLINDLGYCALISHTGGGTSFHLSPKDRKILRYRYNSVPADRPGRYLYLRDMDSGDYWSATWAPVMKPLDSVEYRCRVGLNVQTISTLYDGIYAEICYFALPGHIAEAWMVRIENRSGRPRKLNTYSYAEFNFWGTLRDLINLDNCPKCSRYHHEAGTIYHYSYNDVGTGLDNMQWVKHWAGFRSTDTPVGFNPERQNFLGDIYRSEANPLVVETGVDSNFTGVGDYPLCGLTHAWELENGESAEFAFVLGMDDKEEGLRAMLDKATNLDYLKRELAGVRARWDGRLANFVANTPDEKEFEACVNTWNPYNSFMTANLSRSVSSYEWGAGRGLGFRDTLQDTMGNCHIEPDLSRERLKLLAGLIYENGTAAHNYFPLTKEPTGNDFYDDHNWLPFALCHYIRETGDFGLLEENVKFVDSERTQTVMERLEYVLETTWRLRGKNGLPQTGHADWNDGLNPGSMESESLFNAMIYCASARDLAELAGHVGNDKLAAKLIERRSVIAEKANGIGWDGGWYRRILFADGGHIGGKDTRPGTIFLEPQTWSIIAGVADRERAITAMDSVNKHLATEWGIKLLDPPFTDYDPSAGSISIFLPGHKENGAIFCHAASWAVVAEAMLGRGELAYSYYKRMAPTTKNMIADLHETEPYIYSQHIAQEPYQRPGRARNSWLTGSATWFMLASSQYILGIRPTLTGLKIAPAIPKSWKQFSVTRIFRGATYDIVVRNPDSAESGIRELTIDGKPVAGDILPIVPAGERVKVEAVMGY